MSRPGDAGRAEQTGWMGWLGFVAGWTVMIIVMCWVATGSVTVTSMR